MHFFFIFIVIISTAYITQYILFLKHFYQNSNLFDCPRHVCVCVCHGYTLFRMTALGDTADVAYGLAHMLASEM